jgi:RNA polymerase sigma-70 factor (ECF subfamily)
LAIIGTARKRFEETVRMFAGDLYRYAYWLCRDRHRAEDIVQDALARAWGAWDTLKDQSAVKSWLYSIVRNEHLRAFERKSLIRDERQPEELDLQTLPLFDMQLDVRQALRALPLSLREPLLMQVLGGFSCKEIAQVLQTTDGAVMTRLTRARLALRNLLERGPKYHEATR